jgi:DNA-binding NarL/FixJ family response regulator
MRNYEDDRPEGLVLVRHGERVRPDVETGEQPWARAVFVSGDHLWEHALGWLVAGAGVEIVGRGRDVNRASELVARHCPDILFVDTSGGVEPDRLLRALRETCRIRPTTSIVVACSRGDHSLRDCAFAGGAVAVADRDRPRDVIFALGAAVAASATDGVERRPNLTRREVEILRLLGDGRTSGEVAKVLWLTEQTVKYHLARAYKKLGVRTRADALAWARSAGIAVKTEPGDLPSTGISPSSRNGW